MSARLAYGNMRSAGGWWDPAKVTEDIRRAGVRAHVAALEAGYTLFDTADIYCRGVCEEILSQSLRENRGMRERIVIATKCGIRFAGDPNLDSPHRYDFSAEHIISSCDGSLRRIGIETIDLYHLHRPDVLMNPGEIAGAFDKLKRAGKVREFGVSNFSPSMLAMVQAHCPMPLIVNQVEIHPGRLDCFVDGTLDQCLERTITPLSWSPLGGGWLGAGGRPIRDDDPNRELKQNLLKTLDDSAAAHGVNRTIVTLAWLLKHPSGIIPIVGSNNPEHLRDATRAEELELSRDEWYRILLAARGKPLP